MSLFKKKKAEAKTPVCACREEVPTGGTAETESVGEFRGNTEDCIYRVKVLGAGCKSCHGQYKNAKQAVRNMGLDVEVEYITDMQKVMEYGVMSMPAIVVGEQVVSMGKVLKADDMEGLLHNLGF